MNLLKVSSALQCVIMQSHLQVFINGLTVAKRRTQLAVLVGFRCLSTNHKYTHSYTMRS